MVVSDIYILKSWNLITNTVLLISGFWCRAASFLYFRWTYESQRKKEKTKWSRVFLRHIPYFSLNFPLNNATFLGNILWYMGPNQLIGTNIHATGPYYLASTEQYKISCAYLMVS